MCVCVLCVWRVLCVRAGYGGIAGRSKTARETVLWGLQWTILPQNGPNHLDCVYRAHDLLIVLSMESSRLRAPPFTSSSRVSTTCKHEFNTRLKGAADMETCRVHRHDGWTANGRRCGGRVWRRGRGDGADLEGRSVPSSSWGGELVGERRREQSRRRGGAGEDGEAADLEYIAAMCYDPR